MKWHLLYGLSLLVRKLLSLQRSLRLTNTPILRHEQRDQQHAAPEDEQGCYRTKQLQQYAHKQSARPGFGNKHKEARSRLMIVAASLYSELTETLVVPFGLAQQDIENLLLTGL